MREQHRICPEQPDDAAHTDPDRKPFSTTGAQAHECPCADAKQHRGQHAGWNDIARDTLRGVRKGQREANVPRVQHEQSYKAQLLHSPKSLGTRARSRHCDSITPHSLHRRKGARPSHRVRSIRSARNRQAYTLNLDMPTRRTLSTPRLPLPLLNLGTPYLFLGLLFGAAWSPGLQHAAKQAFEPPHETRAARRTPPQSSHARPPPQGRTSGASPTGAAPLYRRNTARSATNRPQNPPASDKPPHWSCPQRPARPFSSMRNRASPQPSAVSEQLSARASPARDWQDADTTACGTADSGVGRYRRPRGPTLLILAQQGLRPPLRRRVAASLLSLRAPARLRP